MRIMLLTDHLSLTTQVRKPGSDYDGGGVKSEIVLRDGGSGYPDITARDGVYTGYLTDYSPKNGFYALSVRASDNEGRAQVRDSQCYES